MSPTGGLCHIAGEDCLISNRIFTPISGHIHVLFVTDVVNQGISLPSVANLLLLVSLPLLCLLCLDIPVNNFVCVILCNKVFFFPLGK